MTDRAALERAIEAIEKATNGSRELDDIVYRIVGALIPLSRLGRDMTQQPEWVGGYSGSAHWLPFYTTSLDAALTLVPDGVEWQISTLYGVARAEVGLNTEGQSGDGERKDDNAPLALCLAALRARLAMMGDKCGNYNVDKAGMVR